MIRFKESSWWYRGISHVLTKNFFFLNFMSLSGGVLQGSVSGKCLSELTFISSPTKNLNQVVLVLREAALN